MTFILSGCMVGPDYVAPDAPIAPAWSQSGAPDALDDTSRWWNRFNDPVLDGLVDQALRQNLTLREAGLRVIESRARRGISVGRFFPQVQAVDAGIDSNDVSRNSPQGIGDPSYDTLSIGVSAVWELDFWGRFRRGIEAQDAALEASVADFGAVRVLLIADVASDYVRIRSLQEQLILTAANIRAQRDILDLTRIRFESGAVSELDVATAQATLSNTESLIPRLEDSLRQTKLALCVLLGRTPSDLVDEFASSAPVPTVASAIALGIPADLLRRRPDVRRAERVAASLCAGIGIATADLYPSISIRGSTGFKSSDFHMPRRSPGIEDLLTADSFMGFLGLGIDWPVLDYGRIKNNIRVADARFQQGIIAYQNTVLQAASEVESGLSTFLRSREQETHLAASVDASRRRVELSLIQYREGAVDFLRVNQANVDLVDRENSLVIARAQVALGAIAVYRALGGGWETRPGAELVPQETINEMRARTDWGDILSPDYESGSDLLFKRKNPGVHTGEGNPPDGR